MTPTYEQAKLWFTPVRELRFWRKVDKRDDGCWMWRGALTDTGHGQCVVDGGNVRVHRLTWILTRQRDIPDEMVIRHLLCDNKPCCNPAHIVGGTQGENVRDIWLVHKPYDWSKEQEARAEYMNHPYSGCFNDCGTVYAENILSIAV